LEKETLKGGLPCWSQRWAAGGNSDPPRPFYAAQSELILALKNEEVTGKYVKKKLVKEGNMK
jgi:hypothetical protein